jgi:hypothetical protein
MRRASTCSHPFSSLASIATFAVACYFKENFTTICLPHFRIQRNYGKRIVVPISRVAKA